MCKRDRPKIKSKNIKLKEKTQIEFFAELIINSPDNSELIISGFYNEMISEKSFRKLFTKEQIPERSKTGLVIIPINSIFRPILLDIAEFEQEKLIDDIIHFAIEYKNETIFHSYDNMKFMEIIKSEFPKAFIELIKGKYEPLELGLKKEIINNGFFERD